MLAQQRVPSFEITAQMINRWSPRAFADKPVPDNMLFGILEAARWAPSAINLQPWRFILARTKTDLEKFHTFIRPSNLVWCAKAPVLVVIV